MGENLNKIEMFYKEKLKSPERIYQSVAYGFSCMFQTILNHALGKLTRCKLQN